MGRVNRQQSVLVAAFAAAAAMGSGEVTAGGWGHLDLDHHGYIGLQASTNEYRIRPGGEWVGDADPNAVLLRAGAHANRFLSIEARLGTGLSEGEGDEVDVELGTFYGLYGRGHLPVIGDWASLYIVVGYTRSELTLRFAEELDHLPETVSEKGFSRGVGVDLYITRRIGLNAEYIEYFDEHDAERDHRLHAIGFGVIGVF
ncbi:outer membrane beta-barrel protein [Halorhodospira abdelmalekii]|uniref:outer membrane beta-barrel protein n=1 Tax=Halorhodospira abdelmalekii TaxID=421629 RepID=UPI00190315C3